MKRLLSFLLVSALCVVCTVPSFAVNTVPQQKNETVISVSEENLGNGFTMKTVTSVLKSNMGLLANVSSQSKTYRRTGVVEHNGSRIGSITLTASFGYDGSSAWVNSMRTSHSIASGWSYENESTWKSGGTANMSASMIKRLAFITIAEADPSLSMTCSPSGQIS